MAAGLEDTAGGFGLAAVLLAEPEEEEVEEEEDDGGWVQAGNVALGGSALVGIGCGAQKYKDTQGADTFTQT